MATRRERVVLELEDNFSSGMAKAAAAAALFEKQLEGLSGTAVRTSRGSSGLGSVGDEAEKAGRKTEAAGRQIDRFSGRLALLAKTAAVLGPALVPIGAAAVPAVMGLTAQLGAAAGAAGVAALAFSGLGDGLDAINDYQLEPTADNLQAMRIEMEKLGPAGADMARFLDSITPELQSLQFAAREGLFPGVEDGITNLLGLLPRVRRIVSDIAEGMGELAADAGADLAGPEWRKFFTYLETDARPTLEDLGRTIGNFAQGFGEMIAAFGPLSRDFSSGLEEMSQRFADWAAGLEDSTSFQNFVSYARDAGPKVLDLLGSMADLFVGIVTAAAPVGDVVLPALTALVKVAAALVESPLGPVFFATAAGLAAYSAAANVATAASTRLSAGMAAVGASAKGLAAIAALAAIGVHIHDVLSASSEATAGIERLQDAVSRMDASSIRSARDELQRLIDIQHPAEGGLNNYIDAVKGSFNDLTGRTAEMKFAVEEANVALRNGGGIADLFGQSIGRTGEEMEAAAGSAQAFSGALAELNGWLDKRQALRDYRDGLADLRAGLKEGFGPDTVERIDAVGRNLAQVASQIKDKSLRADFLAGARKSLVNLAEGAGPKAQAAVQKLINKLDELGLTNPKPKVDADTKNADGKLDRTGRKADELDRKRPRPKVDVDDGAALNSFSALLSAGMKVDKQRPRPVVTAVDNASGVLSSVANMLYGLDGQTATTYIKTVRSVSSFVYGDATPGSADGGTVPKTGQHYADRHPYLLADGEEVISNRHGQADRWRPFLKAINAGRLADGGTTGIGTAAVASRGPQRTLDDLLAIAQTMQEIRQLKRDLAKDGKNRLDGLNRRIANLQLKAAEKELRLVRNREEREARQEAREKAKEQREELRDRASGIRDIGAGLSFDGLLPREEQTFAQQTRAEINAFKQSILDAGGVWDKSMRAWAKDTMAVAHEYQALSGAIERETAKRDELAESLSQQQSQMADLVRTMESYASSVAGNFLSNPFGQSRTETIPGAPGEASAALSSAQAQLAAIRSSATGDSVGAAAEASRLIAQIASLEERAAAEVAPRERTIDGLELFEETLNRDIEQARRMTEALKTLAAKGLDTSGELGLLYQQLAASGDVVTAEDLARLSASQIEEYERLFAARENAAATVGALATQEVYGQQQAQLQTLITAQTEAIARQDATLAVLNAELAVVGEEVRLGAAAGVAALQPQIDRLTREVQQTRQAVRNQSRQNAEQKKKARA